ncbi:unnamed protein product, partial [Rotaria socialis]
STSKSVFDPASDVELFTFKYKPLVCEVERIALVPSSFNDEFEAVFDV